MNSLREERAQSRDKDQRDRQNHDLFSFGHNHFLLCIWPVVHQTHSNFSDR